MTTNLAQELRSSRTARRQEPEPSRGSKWKQDLGSGPGGVSMPITHQAPFGTMGTIHASDSLKHERGVSRLEGGARALEGPVVSERVGRSSLTLVRPPIHPKPKQI